MPKIDHAPSQEPILTEAERLSMPASDYMNAKQLAFFRARLETLRAELLEHAVSARALLDVGDLLPDPNDRATIEEEHLLEQRRLDRERKYLKKIDGALWAILPSVATRAQSVSSVYSSKQWIWRIRLRSLGPFSSTSAPAATCRGRKASPP